MRMLLVFPAFRTDNALIGVLDPWNERLVTADGSANTSEGSRFWLRSLRELRGEAGIASLARIARVTD